MHQYDRKNKDTWNGVVQYEAKEASYKHTGCQKNLQHLVKFYHTWTQSKAKC